MGEKRPLVSYWNIQQHKWEKWDTMVYIWTLETERFKERCRKGDMPLCKKRRQWNTYAVEMQKNKKVRKKIRMLYSYK
jgi:hypothetical protein